jgi:putative transposase
MAEPTPRERAYRLRCYPSARQRRVLGRLFGASRFVWNWALSRRTSASQADQTRLNWISLSRQFTALRQAPETRWLCELPWEPFNQVLRDQERALQHFFARRARHPRFRRRGGRDCVRFALDQRHAQVERNATPRRALVDLPGLRRLKLRCTEVLEGRLRSVMLTRLRRYQRGQSHQLAAQMRAQGFDPNAPCPKRVRLGTSRRRVRQRARIARLHGRIAALRRDALHRVSTVLVGQERILVLEDLNVKRLSRGVGRRDFRRAMGAPGAAL